MRKWSGTNHDAGQNIQSQKLEGEAKGELVAGA